ncbi:phosphoglycerate kinase [Gammaproteobacteria bacterium]|nr:phosphoglycerate kinase [SAR86 cluster bacterium]MDB3880962.1 phosphoglycerate kinase [Gammaproteobacteria bacterium]
MRYKKLKDISLSNKSVLLRLDLNAPIQNGVVTNNERLLRSLPTISYLLEKGASLKIMSHLGRPEENDLFQEAYSLKPVVVELERLLDRPIPLHSLNEIESMDDFSDLVMIENTRFNIGEKNNDPTLSKRFSDLADLFVMDAFATSHRAHASTTGVISFSDVACAGFLLDEELSALLKVKEDNNKSIAILGGAKISTKLGLIDSLSQSMDAVVLGGGIANTCLAAKGFNIGKSLVEPSMLKEAEQLLKNPKVIIPEIVVVSQSPDQPGREVAVDKVGENEAIFDISPNYVLQLESIINQAGTILWNGPIGFFEKENFDKGTIQLAKMIVASKAYSVAGGGDTISAAEKAGVLDKLDYVSTAGGAFLEFIEGRKLPAIEALMQK